MFKSKQFVNFQFPSVVISTYFQCCMICPDFYLRTVVSPIFIQLIHEWKRKNVEPSKIKKISSNENLFSYLRNFGLKCKQRDMTDCEEMKTNNNSPTPQTLFSIHIFIDFLFHYFSGFSFFFTHKNFFFSQFFQIENFHLISTLTRYLSY